MFSVKYGRRHFTNEELSGLFRRIREGDIEARNELVSGFYHLVIKICQKALPSQENDDTIQNAMIGLLKAANTFDESKGVKFITYASVCVFNEVRASSRKDQIKKDEWFDVEEIVDGYRDHQIEDWSVIEKELNLLPTRDREVICRRHGLYGYPQETLDEIGHRFHFSRERTRQIQARSESKLRKALAKIL